MTESHSAPKPYDAMKRKVNRFLLIALAGIVAVVLLVSYKQGAFDARSTLVVRTSDATGINTGTPVRLFGVQVGTVRGMTISGAQVRVELSVATGDLPLIPASSQVRLTRDSYVGGASLHIIPRVPTAAASRPVAPGDELEFVQGRTVFDVIEDIKAQVTPLVGDLRAMVADLNRPDSDYRKSTAAARELIAHLNETSVEARRLLRDADRSVASADSAFKSVSRVSARAEVLLPSLAGKLATTLESFADAANEVREATRKNSATLQETLQHGPALMRGGADLVKSSGELVKSSSEVMREGSDLLRDGQEIAGAVRSVWPIRNLVEAPAMRTLPLDSFEGLARAYPVAAAPR